MSKKERQRMVEEKWREAIAALPPNMTLYAASKVLNRSYGSVRMWLKRMGYVPARPDALNPANKLHKLRPDNVDWTLPPTEISRKYQCSRALVYQMAKKYGIGLHYSRKQTILHDGVNSWNPICPHCRQRTMRVVAFGKAACVKCG